MKKIQTASEELLIVGTGAELLPVYKAMDRAYFNCRSNYSPVYLDAPKMRSNKMYGIFIDHGEFRVVTADFGLWYLTEYDGEKGE